MEENDTKVKTIVNILWTGGWDSTFRIITLANKDLVIQPYYVRDNRKSEQNELNAINSITKIIRGLNTTVCQLNDIKVFSVSDVEKDEEITNAYKSIYAKAYFGGQYDWLARFSKKAKDLELELSIHQDDKACSVIQAFGNVKKINNDNRGEYYKIDPSSSTDELIKVFGNFNFPLLKYSKLSMMKEAEEKGFLDILHMTWFCYTPFNNEACGLCNPCKYTMEEGLSFRFSKAAIKRYKQKVRRYKRNKILAPIKKTMLYRIMQKIKGLLTNKKLV